MIRSLTRSCLIFAVIASFINIAYAQAPAATPTQQGPGFSMLFMFLIFIGFMYFAMWRPQQKKAKEHRELLTSLTKGDEVVTIGGILGKVVKVNDNYIVLALADDVEITIQKSAISSALPKGTLKSL